MTLNVKDLVSGQGDLHVIFSLKFGTFYISFTVTSPILSNFTILCQQGLDFITLPKCTPHSILYRYYFIPFSYETLCK